MLARRLRTRPTRLAWATFVAIAGLCEAAAAQQAQGPSDEPARTLPSVTVSASGLDTPSEQMAAPVTVLQGEDLVQRRGGSLGETLETQPGIHASHFGIASSRPIIRGLDAARVRVLSDGAEVMDASTISPDHAVALEPMLSRRIEVIRGPSALAYGGGAIGGVVNVLDERIPTRLPADGLEGSAELRGNSASREGTGAFGITAGSGSFAIRAEGLVRRADDYAVGGGWSEGRRVEGSHHRSETGSLGMSWIGDRGYLGLAYTRQQSRYGLPGHAHDMGECHADDDHLHCEAHDDHPDEDHAHEHEDHAHEEDHAHGVPYVDLRSNRWDLRGEYLVPFAGIAKIRLRAGLTDYAHDEVEDGEVATRFRSKGREGRIEMEHRPIAGWRGVFGLQASQRDFGATGEEAYVQPTVTRRQGLFLVEERRFGPVRVEAGLRHEWQQVDAELADTRVKHQGSSASVGAHWGFHLAYSLGLTLSRTQRLPTAEELFADGRHLATRTIERGNADLRRETANNVDLTLRKLAGETRFTLTAFHKRIGDYIYANTLDAVDGVRLIEYAQRDAVFNGVEAQVSRKLGPMLGATLFGDFVRARLAEGDGNRNLPRIPAARYGVRLDTWISGWDGSLEFYRVAKQARTDDFETPTAGYNILDIGVNRNFRVGGTRAQFYLAAKNLGNVLAFSHTSYIKEAAPLLGRRVVAGVRLQF